MNGIILHEGPSTFTGEPLVSVATLTSRNRKTGDIPQVWHLLKDRSAAQAVATGTDSGNCGSCKYRGNCGCYVRTAEAPGNIWRSLGGYQRGKKALDLMKRYAAFVGIARNSAYGDPAAVDADGDEQIRRLFYGVALLDYTHAWQTRPDLMDRCMASVDTSQEREQAKAAGWRTFRVAPAGSPLEKGEILCPATAGSKRIQCLDCRLCAGGNTRKAPDVLEHLHGPTKKAQAAIAGRLIQIGEK